MNYLDIIILVFLAFSVYHGFKRGFVMELASILALILGIWAAFYFSGWTEDFLKSFLDIQERYLPAIAFAVTFLAAAIIITLIGLLIDRFLEMIALGFINKLLGLFFGLLKGILIASLILFLIGIFDTGEKLIKPKTKENSFLYQPISKLIRYFLPEQWKEDKQAEPEERIITHLRSPLPPATSFPRYIQAWHLLPWKHS